MLYQHYNFSRCYTPSQIGRADLETLSGMPAGSRYVSSTVCTQRRFVDIACEISFNFCLRYCVQPLGAYGGIKQSISNADCFSCAVVSLAHLGHVLKGAESPSGHSAGQEASVCDHCVFYIGKYLA